MSILNAFVTPDLALIGVDTEAKLPDGTTLQACKLVTVPHLGAAAGFRGLDVLQMFAASAIIGFKGDFDALAETMPGLLTEAERFCRDQFGASGDALVFNVVLVGYSESAGRMVGHVFDRRADCQEIKAASGFQNFIAPDVAADQLGSLHIAADKPGMAILASHQCQLIRDKEPNMPAGGRFFIAEVRRHSIHIEQAMEFPPRPEKVG